MTDIKVLDFTDPLIRAMADQNHVPEETWTVGGSLISVACEACGYEWPCATRTALRALGAGYQ